MSVIILQVALDNFALHLTRGILDIRSLFICWKWAHFAILQVTVSQFPQIKMYYSYIFKSANAIPTRWLYKIWCYVTKTSALPSHIHSLVMLKDIFFNRRSANLTFVLTFRCVFEDSCLIVHCKSLQKNFGLLHLHKILAFLGRAKSTDSWWLVCS